MFYAILDPSKNYNNCGAVEIPSASLSDLSAAAEDYGTDVAGAGLEVREDLGYHILHRDGQHLLIFARL
jgi:hypothetical protein